MRALRLLGLQEIRDSLWWKIFGCCRDPSSHSCFRGKQKSHPRLSLSLLFVWVFSLLGEAVFFLMKNLVPEGRARHWCSQTGIQPWPSACPLPALRWPPCCLPSHLHLAPSFANLSLVVASVTYHQEMNYSDGCFSSPVTLLKVLHLHVGLSLF